MNCMGVKGSSKVKLFNNLLNKLIGALLLGLVNSLYYYTLRSILSSVLVICVSSACKATYEEAGVFLHMQI